MISSSVRPVGKGLSCGLASKVSDLVGYVWRRPRTEPLLDIVQWPAVDGGACKVELTVG